jgi:hypothetical protein
LTKYINKPAERDPDVTAPKSKHVVKMSDSEMRDALISVMTHRERVAAATLAAPYTSHRRRFVDSDSSIIDLWKYGQRKKGFDSTKPADKDGNVVSLW